jgi:hypothetical protein
MIPKFATITANASEHRDKSPGCSSSNRDVSVTSLTAPTAQDSAHFNLPLCSSGDSGDEEARESNSARLDITCAPRQRFVCVALSGEPSGKRMRSVRKYKGMANLLLHNQYYKRDGKLTQSYSASPFLARNSPSASRPATMSVLATQSGNSSSCNAGATSSTRPPAALSCVNASSSS